MSFSNRRSLMGALGAFSVLGMGSPAFGRTPRAMEGPFYPTLRMRFKDADNNLVRIEGLVRDAGGEIMILSGVVLDPDGAPAAGARVEIWQTDANGVYLHSADRKRGFDEAFQGFGHVVTGSDGAYAFRTIKPVPYTGRTPHVHVKVFYAGMELTTQFYLHGHPLNARDRLYNRMSAEAKEAVAMRLRDGPDGMGARVDIRL